jgi:1,4-dihydroxy-2-naphthoate octaprenyltransferase
MPSESLPATNPAPEDFAGNTPGQVARRLFHATRPKFYPASLLPVLAGTAWGFNVSGRFDFSVFLLALLATTCVHAAANVLNDVGDDSGGTDRRNEDRIYPYTGGSRFIQAGIMEASHMARLGITLLAIAAIAAVALLFARGPMILAFGLTGVALGVLYSLGPVRLSNLGIGETAVAVAFGVLPVTGAAWLQSGIIDVESLLFSLPISAWVASILLINEVPDIGPDGSTGKRTLPVRLGLAGTAMLYLGIQLFAAIVVICMTVVGPLPLAAPIVPVALLLLAFKAAAAIRGGLQDRDTMRRGIEATLGIHTVGSLWLCGIALYAAWWPAG